MGNTRGSKVNKRGRLRWKNRKANKGRKPAMGHRKGMLTWAEVRPQILRNATRIIVPAKADAGEAKTEETQAE